MQKMINVLIVDNHQLMVEGMQALLGEEPHIHIIPGVNSSAAALQVLATAKVDVVLTDVNMPGMSGVELTKTIKASFPHVKVVALTMSCDSITISQMVEAGAAAYVMKSTSISELCNAIYAVAKGGKFLSLEVQEVIMKNVYRNNSSASRINSARVKLSARETEILHLISQQMTCEEISKKLLIGKRTVETHRRNILTKTKTTNNTRLLQYAIEKGMISK